MAVIDTTFLNRIQDHALAKLLSEPLLQYVGIASMRHLVKLDVAARVAPHLAGRNGKVGNGILIGLPLAGIINDLSNWRMAMFLVGAPGLVLTLLVLLTVRERKRRLVLPLLSE